MIAHYFLSLYMTTEYLNITKIFSKDVHIL